MQNKLLTILHNETNICLLPCRKQPVSPRNWSQPRTM